VIRKGATGTAAAIAFSVIDADGNPVNDKGEIGNPWNDTGSGFTDELELYCPGTGSFDDICEISRILNIGTSQGMYLYLLDAADTAEEGLVAIRTVISGYENREHFDTIVDIAEAIFGSVREANAHVGARTYGQRERILFSIAAGNAPQDLNASPYYFRDRPGAVTTKDRASYTMVNGVRTATDLDGDE
jgi:hypothetical protein